MPCVTTVCMPDSSGMHALLTLRREAQEHSKRLVVEALQPQPRQVLQVLNLESFFG